MSNFHRQVSNFLFTDNHTILFFFFSPSSGRAWAAASTEGLLIYSLDEGVVFDPYDLSEEVTPEGVAKALEEGNFSAALMMSFRLNEKNLLINSLEATPTSDSKLVSKQIAYYLYLNINSYII